MLQKKSQSEKHLESRLAFHNFGNEKRIETSLNSQLQLDIVRHNAKVDRNRNIFNRLIDITCHLDKQELTFRVHEETEDRKSTRLNSSHRVSRMPSSA